MSPKSLTGLPAAAEGRAAQYVFPFVLFLILLWVFGQLTLKAAVTAPLWFLSMLPVCIVCWPHGVRTRPVLLAGSIAVGMAVFLLWVAPEVLIPGYRNFPLFSNSIIGHTKSSLSDAAVQSRWVLAWRTARAMIIVPVVEELFWRGWLMRWIIDTSFERVPLGTYSPMAFWVTAILFASEHGPYWDVGLITGIIYNLWMIRTKSIASCVLMHAVTNGLLSIYVIAAGQWQYWQ